MKRQGGHYGGDSGGGGGGHHAYGGGDADYNNNQWRWERDGAPHDKLPQSSMSQTPPYAQGQGREAPRSSYQSQRMDLRMTLEKHGDGDLRSQPREQEMGTGYKDNRGVQTIEGLERKFLDDILSLSKEQADAEDAENARHRERINAINAQYEVQLAALRVRHTNRREEFLQRESLTRHQQYQQLGMEQYPPSGLTPNDSRGYNVDVTSPTGESNRSYNSDHYDSYREGGRFTGNAREHGYGSKAPYSRGRSYDGGPRYY